MLHSLWRLERWKLIKIKEEENSEDMLVLSSSTLISPFSAEENNIELYDSILFVCVCVDTHRILCRWDFVETENLHTGQVKRTILSASRLPLILFIIRRQHRYFSPPFLTQIDGAPRPNDWKRKRLGILFSDWPFQENLSVRLWEKNTTVRDLSWIRIIL